MLDTQMTAATAQATSQETTQAKPLHGYKNLKLIENNYRRNISSDYTERMEHLAADFSYADHADVNWLDPEFSLLYGSPIYEQASDSQKRALNHLYWVCFYNYSIGGEVATMVFNQLTCGAFYPLGGYETLCRELDVETSQERTHVEAFRRIGQATEMALLGELIFDRPIPSFMDSAMVHPQQGGRAFFQNILPQAYYQGISRSPFMASQYYTVRGIRNIQLKVKEYQHSQFFQKLEQSDTPAALPAPSAISHYHYLDEAFHTATSQLVSHQLYKDFPKPSLLDRSLSNIGVLGVQRTVRHLSAAVPGIFSEDRTYLPLVDKMLQSPLFGLSASESLRLLQASFCQEHEGFHVGAKYHQRALSDNRKYVDGLDYLWPINRDLRIMASASIEKALKLNQQAWQEYTQTRAA
ncbi:MAG: hypothetical protein NW237_00935 [Cyanobacteriota bacterium]|nr:hypothetical protein [Cyanobacteriota bacterium]